MIPIKEDLISKIIEIEWDMFINVPNANGIAPCQQDGKTFLIMRSSQAMSWTDPMLESYLADLINARQNGRNLMTEKYARMMEQTFPAEYAKISERLPLLNSEVLFLVNRITNLMLQWADDSISKYPKTTSAGRPLRSTADTPYATSLETYWRCELSTYGIDTLRLCYEYFINCLADRRNIYEVILENTVRQYGYTSIRHAEEKNLKQR